MFRKGMAGRERQQDRYNMLLLFRSYYMMLGPKGQKSSRKQACIGFLIFLPRYHYIQEEFLHLLIRKKQKQNGMKQIEQTIETI